MPNPIRCRRVTPRLWGYLAADLDPPAEDEVADHLDTCDHCSAELARIEAVCRLLRTYPPGTQMPAVVHARLGSLLQGLEQTLAAAEPTRTRVCTRRWESRRPR